MAAPTYIYEHIMLFYALREAAPLSFAVYSFVYLISSSFPVS